jgi:hypothetical protein
VCDNQISDKIDALLKEANNDSFKNSRDMLLEVHAPPESVRSF